MRRLIEIVLRTFEKASRSERITWAVISLLLYVVAYCRDWLRQAGFSWGGAFLNIVAGDIIINVLGLVYVVMRFLFPNREHKVDHESYDTSEGLFELPFSR